MEGRFVAVTNALSLGTSQFVSLPIFAQFMQEPITGLWAPGSWQVKIFCKLLLLLSTLPDGLFQYTYSTNMDNYSVS